MRPCCAWGHIKALPWGQLNLDLRQEVSARRAKATVKQGERTSQREQQWASDPRAFIGNIRVAEAFQGIN